MLEPLCGGGHAQCLFEPLCGVLCLLFVNVTMMKKVIAKRRNLHILHFICKKNEIRNTIVSLVNKFVERT
jgi:hypothetical protein